MRQLTRRNFVRSTAAIGGAGLFGVHSSAQDTGQDSDPVRMAVIGTGGRGSGHLSSFKYVQGAKVVALCDADDQIVNRAAEKYEERSGDKVDRYLNYETLLERSDIDAVLIATPNHWHALMTIHACQAGKHVYVEKPVCHTIWEGRQMVRAAKKHDRFVAAGFQNRSDVGLREAIPRIHAGELGAIKQARGLCYRSRGSIGKLDEPLVPPKEVNYDLWLGPAADLPIMRPRFHYDWHWVFNTGNGDMGNQGPHEMDLLQWALGEPGHPKRVVSFGGRFGWNDAGNTPNMQCAVFDFGNDVPVLFEVRNLHQKEQPKLGAYKDGPGVGIIITCENGEFRGGRGGGAFYDTQGQEIAKFKGDSGRDHMQNFIDSVKANRPEDLRAKIEQSFFSSCMSHLGNISLQTGTEMNGDQLKQHLQDDALTTEVFERFTDQMDFWNVDTKATPWQVGDLLTFDSDSEQFVGGNAKDQANQIVRRQDRPSYQVPDYS